MKSVKTKFAINGLLIGLIAGAIAGLGLLNTFKKSQRGTISMYAIVGCAIVTAISGYRLGYRMGKEADIENTLGISEAQNGIAKKEGSRYWYAFTQWTDKRDGKESLLFTIQDDNKELITYMNGEPITNHHIKSGSKDNVTKYHQGERNYIFKQLKDSFR